MSAILTGIIPVAPTIFHDDESLDLDGQRRVVDFLVDSKVDALCILANYSEQFSLEDDERRRVIDATLEQAAGRVPVMVTTSHYSARVAARRTREAAEAGARLAMLMPPFFGATMSVGEDLVLDYFATVAEQSAIDIMVQDAPLSTTPLSVALLARLATEIPQVKYVKVEVPRAAAKIRALRTIAGADLPGVFDGEEGVTLIPDLHAGAIGTMASCTIPDVLGEVVRRFGSGDIDGATRAWNAVLPLIHFENRQCGLQAAKALLKEGGVIASDRVRAPLAPLPASTRAELLALADRARASVLGWAR
ncbi:dihydrodipicolinate synthase family protein [Herbiconiux sp. UC225_62]|uniref:dihydrodipicolinate synthase family protein n=1 Tax=Herbiconiux sp. UC225_62 TaxID=3350168 RepID=UPI0036D3EB24